MTKIKPTKTSTLQVSDLRQAKQNDMAVINRFVSANIMNIGQLHNSTP